MLSLRVRDVIAATPRARVIKLDLGGQPFDYAAGQAVVVGSGSQRRPYSLAAAPEDARRDDCLELLANVGADGRIGPHLPLDSGAPVTVDGPLGTFTFPNHPAESSFVFIAGGSGIAPLRAMMRHVIVTWPPGFDRPRIGLLYSARTPEEFAYAEEFHGLARDGVIELRQTVTRAKHDGWSGAHGRIDRAALSSLVHDPRTLCFVCGPAAMVDEIPKLLEDLGVARARIKIEEW